jgi:hypothetical protein
MTHCLEIQRTKNFVGEMNDRSSIHKRWIHPVVTVSVLERFFHAPLDHTNYMLSCVAFFSQPAACVAFSESSGLGQGPPYK